MRQTVYIIFGLMLLGVQGLAQTVVNGDMEPIPSSTVTMCDMNGYMHINTMNGIFLVTAPIDDPLPYAYVSDNSCSTGLAESGNHYMGLSYSPVANESGKILLELTSPMQPMKSYTVTFYYKGPVASVGNGAEIEFGFSRDSLPTGLTDSTLGSIAAPAYDIWQKVSVIISSPYVSSYIWVGAKANHLSPTDTAITFIDNFSIEKTGIVDPKKTDQLHLYPNPFSTSTKLILPPSAKVPCSLAIYDITGKCVIKEDNINQKEFTINRSSLNSGSYILKLTDRNRKVLTTTLTINQ